MCKTLKEIRINTQYIKLGDFLKLASICSSGGEAKIRIINGEILVNNEVCTMRGKKLRDKDIITADGVEYIIKNETN